MSNYIRRTWNPIAKEFQDAEWLDDYYGKHQYGVRFPDGRVYKAESHDWKFEDTPEAQGSNPTSTEELPKLQNDLMYQIQDTVTNHIVMDGDPLFDLATDIKALFDRYASSKAKAELEAVYNLWHEEGGRKVGQFVKSRLAALNGGGIDNE